MKYYVTVAVSGYVNMEIEADTLDEAAVKGDHIVNEMYFGELESIGWDVVSVEKG